jgi:ABC-2 type transport system permease protein
MRNTITIARRELTTYFNTPVAYVVVPLFLVMTGGWLFSTLFFQNEATLRAFFTPFWGAMTPNFFSAPFALAIFAPLVTMRLLAEEQQTGTLEVLMTLPVGDWEVVVGKYLAAMALLGVTLLITIAFPISIRLLGPLDLGPVVGGYVGLVLLGSFFMAVGLMASSFTRNQIVAALISLAVCLFIFFIGQFVPLLPTRLVPFFEYISVSYHFDTIARGVIDTRVVIYYATLTAACLLVTQTSLTSRRWR